MSQITLAILFFSFGIIIKIFFDFCLKNFKSKNKKSHEIQSSFRKFGYVGMCIFEIDAGERIKIVLDAIARDYNKIAFLEEDIDAFLGYGDRYLKLKALFSSKPFFAVIKNPKGFFVLTLSSNPQLVDPIDTESTYNWSDQHKKYLLIPERFL
jgi:hypothetical protein